MGKTVTEHYRNTSIPEKQQTQETQYKIIIILSVITFIAT